VILFWLWLLIRPSMDVNDLPIVASPSGWHEALPVLSMKQLYAAVASGQLRALRDGRRILIARRSMLEFIGEVQPEDE
jgi:hypothetical protein